MRLAQLARKLAIRPSAIVDFLTEQKIEIADGLNTRLEDNHVTLIMQKFAPARAAEIAAELVAEKDEPKEFKQSEPAETPSQTEETAVAGDIDNAVESESAPAELPELIKAPKVELAGLKVLGKIELPEPKKKEPQPPAEEQPGDQPQATEPTAPPERKREKRNLDNRRPSNKRESDRPKINPVALQREREALEAEKKRREQAKLEKEKRKQHYFNKVKTATPIKSAKLIREEVEELKPIAPEPKTVWGKFIKWLNT